MRIEFNYYRYNSLPIYYYYYHHYYQLYTVNYLYYYYYYYYYLNVLNAASRKVAGSNLDEVDFLN
jgi:hypothetical protein